jgi:molybdopterin synthase sulfur carrier subunit
MIINIKYFGMLADITHKREQQLAVEQAALSVSDLKKIMESQHQDLKNTTYTIAVNQVMAGLDVNIKNQDVVAFLPPFAGG